MTSQTPTTSGASVPGSDSGDGITAAAVDAYLARIGADRPVRADIDALRDLQHRHLLAVPFENLSFIWARTSCWRNGRSWPR